MTYILGLDISTSVIGMAVMDLDKNLIDYKNLKLSSKTDLEIRCYIFKKEVYELFEQYAFDQIYVEQPAMMEKQQPKQCLSYKDLTECVAMRYIRKLSWFPTWYTLTPQEKK